MTFDLGRGYIDVYANMGPFESGVADGANKTSKSKKIKTAGRVLGGSLLAGAAGVFKVGLDELLDESAINKQLEAREKSTKGVANATIGHIDRISNSILKLTGIDDEATKSAASMVMTFTNIRNEAGKSNKVFDQTVKAVTDVATAMNNGATPSAEQLSKTSIMLGKAINDPIKGMGALRRVGVSFTEQQEEQVKSWTENGEAIKAQKLILGELNKEFGGSGKALGQSLPGQINKAKETFKNLAADLIRGTLPVMERVLGVVTDVVTFFEHHKDFAKAFLAGMAGVGAALLIAFGGPVTLTVAAIAAIVAGFVEAYKHSETFRKVIDGVGQALQSAFKAALPWITNAFHNVTNAFKEAGKWLGTAFKNAKSTIGTVIQSLKDFWKQSAIVRTGVAVLVGIFKVWAGIIKTVLIAAFNQMVAVVKRIIPAIITVFNGFKQTIKGIVQVVSGILTLNFGRAWTGIKNIFSGSIKVVLGYLRGITAPARQIISTIGDALASAFTKVWDGIKTVFEDGVDKVGGFVQNLADFINPILDAVGVGEIHITATEAQSTSKGGLGKHRSGASFGTAPRKAKGGPVRVPGAGNRDTVPLAVNGQLSAVVAPGEDVMVTNRHQRPLLDAAVAAAYGVNGLGGFFSQYDTPHFMASGGNLPRYASGVLGVLEDVGSVVTAPVRLPAEAGMKLFNTAKNAAQFISGLPSIPDGLHGIFGDIASGVLGKVKDFVTGIPDAIFGGNDPQGDLKGKVSWFSGGATAGGRNTSEPGIAVNLHPGSESGWDNAKTRHWMEQSNAGHPAYANVSIQGHQAKLPITDLGPAGFTNRAIDVTEGGVKKLGFSLAGFPTDVEGVADFLARGGLVNPATGKRGNPFDPIAMRANATSAPADGVQGFLPKTLGRIKNKAKSIAQRFVEYQWGGGHSEGTHVTSNYLDCSGAVAKLMQESGWGDFSVAFSGDYNSRYHSGEGEDFTIWANDEHTFVNIDGKDWGTNTSNGLGYATHTHSGFTATHPELAPESGSGSTATNGAHTFKEDVPAIYRGARTDSLSFGSIPKSLKGIQKELKQRRQDIRLYTKAAEYADKKKRPGIAQAIRQNITALETRIHQLETAQKKAREEIAKKHFTAKLARKLSKLVGSEDVTGEREREFEKHSQYVDQLVALEPLAPELPANATDAERRAAEEAYVAQYTAYVEGQERPAYGRLLDLSASWRNSILSSQTKAAGDWQGGKQLGGLEGNWETQIRKVAGEVEHIEGLPNHTDKWNKAHPKAAAHIKEQRERLPMLKYRDKELRKALGEVRGEFYPGTKNPVEPPNAPFAGSGTLEEALQNVQGIHWPEQHEILKSLPGNRVAGRFGGLIWDVQSSIEELGMKLPKVETESSEGVSSKEREEVLAPLLEEQNRLLRNEDVIRQLDRSVLEDSAVKRVPFGGVFHEGGVVPGRQGEEVMALVEAGETITPAGGGYDHDVSVSLKDSEFAQFLDVQTKKVLRQEASIARRSP
jgi:phage-related protein